MVDIFLSKPNWVAPEFSEGLEGFLNLMKNLDLNPRSLGTTDYPNKAPLDEVIALMAKCHGIVILGYPQILVTKGKVKDNQVSSPLWLPTEWNHIEAGLAYAKGLPMLVVHHKGIKRGIFDRGAINNFIYEVDLSKSNWATSSAITGAIRTWRVNLGKRKAAEGMQVELDQQPTKPFCPNCSTIERRFYLSPIPKEFRDIEDATHECTRCGYKQQTEGTA